MRKTAFLKEKAVVLDFSEFPDREVVEYLVHVSFCGKPYDCMVFQSFDGQYRDWETDRKSTRLNSSHITRSRMPSSA